MPLPPLDARLEEKLSGLSPAAVDAYNAFRKTGDPASLDRILQGTVRFLLPGLEDAGVDLPEDADLMNDLGFDSIAMVELVFWAEDLFGISISDEELVELRTLGAIKQFLRRKLAVAA